MTPNDLSEDQTSIARTNLTRFSKQLNRSRRNSNFYFEKINKFYNTQLKDLDLANINVAKYGVLNDAKGNLTKARTILKKSLDSIALARALISRADKSFLCDKEYVSELNVWLLFWKIILNEIYLKDQTDASMRNISTKSATSAYKMEKFKSIKEKQYKYDKSVQTDSVSNLIADLHVELLYLYHKIGVRLLDFLPPDRKPIPKSTIYLLKLYSNLILFEN